MLLGRMIEQGLAPNTDTYTVLIDGYGRGGKNGCPCSALGSGALAASPTRARPCPRTGTTSGSGSWSFGAVGRGRREEVDALLAAMWAQGFCLDNTTCARSASRDGSKGMSELFRRMSETGTPLNMVTQAAWTDKPCKAGCVQACAADAFRLFLKLVRSTLYKLNVQKYIVMIGLLQGTARRASS
ncbi:hypothetical protein U9M48_001830 [Paspalum notatum var. saurae]|uniref:Pentatricopeptide repeat-containing protein n=1 Tax=Paspalum notatum var. saurae TaxID=547442 RepID=A0AAQ3PK10_PASNO